MPNQSVEISRSELFGLVAPSLGWAPPLRYLLRRTRILQVLRQVPVGEAIEVGCGAGALLDDLTGLGFRAIGLETSSRARDVARTLASHSGRPQIVVDRPQLNWAGSKDLVCAFDVLEHIENADAAISEWISWLRPEGYLMLSVPAHSSWWGPGDEWAGHWRRYDRSDLIQLIQASGLTISHFECYGFPLGNLTELFGRQTYRRMLLKQSKSMSKPEASAQSGVERASAQRIFRYLDTFLGHVALRLCFLLQASAANTNWGCGYLVLARRS